MSNSSENLIRAINIFCEILKKDPNPIIRAKAAETLGKLRNTQALETLFHTWQHDQDINVRCIAADAIVNIIRPLLSLKNPMSDAPKFDLRGAKIGNLADTVQGDQKAIQHNYASSQNLSEAVAEIKKILDQLNLNYATETEAEKETLANQINNNIKSNSRMRKIFLEGGIELVKILCPWLGIPITMGQKWIETAKNHD